MDMPLPRLVLATSQLLARRRSEWVFAPDAGERASIAQALGLIDLPALRLAVVIAPLGRGDLALTGQLTARALQACVVTLAPVPAKIAQEVRRRYLSGWVEPEADEAEIPQDDTLEPLAGQIDLAALAIEELALALPDYPRAPGAELGAREFPPPGGAGAGVGGAEMGAEGAEKPLAGLRALIDKSAKPRG